MDAYTLRKIAPRILIGVIAINLSIYICLAAIDITTVIGKGLGNLITAPFDTADLEREVPNSLEDNLAVGAIGALSVIGGGAYALLAGLGTIFFMLLVVVLLGIAIMITLVIRQGLLVFLTVISPIAIALFIIPNTEKYFRQWWDLFVKALIVYPIIVAIFAISEVLASINIDAASQKGSDGTAEGLMLLIVAIMMAFAPLFLIPFAFRFAGGALSTIMNSAGGPIRQLNARRQRYTQQRMSDNLKGVREGRRFAGGTESNLRGRLNRGLQTTSLVGSAGMSPRGWRRNVQAARSQLMGDAAMQAINDNPLAKGILVNDDLMSAVLHGQGTEADIRSFLSKSQSGRELEQNMGAIRAAQRAVGDNNLRVAAGVALAGTKTGYAGGAGEMLDTIDRIAGSDVNLAQRMAFAARSEASKAQRFDLSEAGAGAYLDGLRDIHNTKSPEERREAIQRAQENVTDDIVQNKQAGYILSGHSNSYKNLVPALQRRITKASDIQGRAKELLKGIDNPSQEETEKAIQTARREFVQHVASSEALIDAASGASPEAAKTIADGYQSATIPIEQLTTSDRQLLGEKAVREGKVTVRQLMDAYGGDQEYKEMRRTYQMEAEQGMAQQAQRAAQAAGTQPGTGPQMGPPTGP